MRRPAFWWLCLGLLAGHASARAPAEVTVLSTLHRLHAEVPAYDNAALARAIEKLTPDVLCIEIGPEAWAARKPERTKVEYPQVVYPLIDAHDWPVCLLEPSDAVAKDMLSAYLPANQRFHAERPETGKAFNAWQAAMYELLKHHWTTPAAVNDRLTDGLMQAKHAMQDALVGADERQGWEAWNRHFLDRIVEAAQQHPGKRIVVLAGAEHGYWLRRELSAQPGLRTLDAATLLAD